MDNHIHVAVDPVIVKDGKILLIKRRSNVFAGTWVFPGGMVEYGETVEQAVVREAKEETGLDIEIIRLIGVYSDPKRDPRFHSVGISFLCRVKGGNLLKESDESTEARYFSLEEARKLDLGFDHRKILEDASRVIK